MNLKEIANLLRGELSEEELKKLLIETRLIKRIANFLPRVSIGLDKDFNIIFINKFITDTLQYGSRDFVGKPFPDFFTNDKYRRQFEKTKKKIKQKSTKPFVMEIPIFSKKGIEKILNWHFLPIYINSEFEFLFSVGEDITETKKAQEKLKETCIVLRKKNTRLSKMIDKLVERELKMTKMKEEIKKLKKQVN